VITRKAAYGFILLAVIVFTVTSISNPRPFVPDNLPQGDISTILDEKPLHIITVRDDTLVYHEPLMNFGDYNPIVITAIIEIFTLFCYLVLKRIEPYIIAWENSERERIKGNLK
jgi:hypothetical protein